MIKAAGTISAEALLCKCFTVSGAVKRSFFTVSSTWALASTEIILNKINMIFLNVLKGNY